MADALVIIKTIVLGRGHESKNKNGYVKLHLTYMTVCTLACVRFKSHNVQKKKKKKVICILLGRVKHQMDKVQFIFVPSLLFFIFVSSKFNEYTVSDEIKTNKLCFSRHPGLQLFTLTLTFIITQLVFYQ